MSASHKIAICKLLRASLPVPGFYGGGQNLTGLDPLDKNAYIQLCIGSFPVPLVIYQGNVS